MSGGWLLRGIHHYMASLMVVLLAIHFVQVVWDGAYRAPRELNFVLGLVLMLIVLALALTGYLLPWDQKGYWATNVGTELASQAPVVGSAVKKLALGGSYYGHHTLTRFFALHAGVLPGLLVAFLVLHVALFRRHGLTPKQPQTKPDACFWPDQVLRDSVAALGLLAVVFGTVLYTGGAELTAPADPASPYAAARPEWYFLFLFQFLKWFPGQLEVWGAFVLPGLILGVLFLMPWIGRSRTGHLLNVALLFVLLGGAALLTVQAVQEDTLAGSAQALFAESGLADTPAHREAFGASKTYLQAQQAAAQQAERVVALARLQGIPPAGALSLMAEDPYLQGPKLFAQHCASCHNFADQEHLAEQKADPLLGPLVNPSPTAPNLFGVGSRAWIRGLLDPERIAGLDYFGYPGSPFVGEGEHTEMVTFLQEDCFGEDSAQHAEARTALEKIAIALSAEAALPAQRTQDAQDADLIAEGRGLLEGGLADVLESGSSCTDCHSFGTQQDIGSPVLEGYMSRQWLIDFIRNPAEERFYGEQNDRMPAFAPHADAQLNQLDEQQLGLLVDWLRGDWVRTGQ
jgi:ubiquinol-cytochrome c reductase cytochrome b subunit